MINEEERKLLLDISYGDTLLEKSDSLKLKRAIKSAMQEIDEKRNTQRTTQGEVIITDDDEVIISDEEEYL